MSNIIAKRTMATAILGLAACGYGGSGNDGGNNAPEPSAFFFGSTDAGASANGLAFADENNGLENVTDQPSQVRLVRFARNTETGEIEIDTIDEEVSFDEDGLATATFNGETLVFEDGIAINGNGEELGSLLSSVRETGFVGIGNTSILFDDITNPAGNAFALGILGLETNPDQIAALTGQVNYEGFIQFLGTTLDQDGQVISAEDSLLGTLSLAVDFEANTVSGSGEFSNNDNLPEFDIAVTETAIQGNGFATDLTIASCADGFTCSADAEIGGVFLGNEGANLSGINGGEFSSVDADGNGTTFVGAGAFATGDEDNAIAIGG